MSRSTMSSIAKTTPAVLIDAFAGAGRAAAERAFDALMTMQKTDVAAIESARRG